MSDEGAAAGDLHPRSAQPGDVIGGRFRIERELGSGGMARVFKVIDQATGKPYALKLLRPEIADDEEAIARLRREGELLDRLDNQAVVGIETYGKITDGRLFLVMELLEGETMGELIRRESRLEPATLSPIVAGVGAGLHAAHRAGVVHRDLKPDNIFLATHPGSSEPQVKILDFGISKAVGFERLTRTGQVLGTPRYMAPEQLAADHDLDARVDVYALGVILYEALAGQPPFLAVAPSELIVAILHGKVTPLKVYRPDLSDDLLTVVSRAMARARDARYGSVRELAEAWLDAAAPHAARGGAVRGMRTRALGGAEDPSPAASSDPGGSLRLGTFSAFEEPADAPVETPVVEGLSTETATAVAKRKPPATEATPTPMTGPLELPMANRRLWLLVAALIAGAVTALLTILALSFFGSEEESSPAPLQTAPAVAPQEAPTAPAETEARPDEETPMQLPEAPDPPETDTEAEAAPEAAPSRRRRRSRRRAAVMGSSKSAAAPAPWAGAAEPASSLDQARSALSAGDPQRCLERLRRAGASPGVLRLRGDCHLRAGNRSEAVKSYERFCRAHPDHSDIPRIRAILERHGGHCR